MAGTTDIPKKLVENAGKSPGLASMVVGLFGRIPLVGTMVHAPTNQNAVAQAYHSFGFTPLFILGWIVLGIICNVSKCFRQYVRKKNKTAGNGVMYGIQRPFVWIINLIAALWRILVTFLSRWFIILYLLTISIGTLLLLAELHQDEMVQFIDVVLEIMRRGYNGYTAFRNLGIEVASLVFVPMWNVVWTFFVQGFVVLMDYMLPLIYSEERGGQFTAAGRRELIKYSEFSFVAPFRDWVLKPLFSVYFMLLKIFFDFILILWRVACWFFFTGPGGTQLKFIFELIGGWPCLLKPAWIGCSFLQIAQLSLDMFVAIINLALSFINFFGASISVPRNLIPDIECKSAPGGITAEECSRCTGVFTGFKKDCANRGSRLLFACDFSEGVWTETIVDRFYNEFKVLHSDPEAAMGCHNTNQLLYGDHFEILHKVRNLNDCIDLRVNGTINAQFCPEQGRRRSLQYHYHHHHLASNHTGRRLSSLSDIFNGQRVLPTRKRKGIEALIPVKVINRTMYNKIYAETPKNNVVYNCTNEPQRGEVFDSLCALQAMSTNPRLQDRVVQFTQSVQSVKLYHSHDVVKNGGTLRRQLEELMYTIQSGKRTVTRRRRLQGQSVPAHANGTCPFGYDHCYGTYMCEVPNSCSCPNVTVALNPYQTVAVVTQNVYCSIKNFDLVEFANDVTGCWREYSRSDSYNPTDVFVGAKEAAFDNKFKYCFPLIDPENPIRWPEIERFTFQDLVSNNASCSRGDGYAKCICPGFRYNIYTYDVYVSQYYGLFVEDRILVTVEILHRTFGAFVNTITWGGANYIWKGLFGWEFLHFRSEMVNLFDVDLSLHAILCITLHLGSPMIVFMYGTIYLVMFINLFPDMVIIAMDLSYGILFFVYKVPLFKKHSMNSKLQLELL